MKKTAAIFVISSAVLLTGCGEDHGAKAINEDGSVIDDRSDLYVKRCINNTTYLVTSFGNSPGIAPVISSDGTIGACKLAQSPSKLSPDLADSEYGEIIDESRRYVRRCIDNTTYLVNKHAKKNSLTPAFKADGTVETCKRSEKDKNHGKKATNENGDVIDDKSSLYFHRCINGVTYLVTGWQSSPGLSPAFKSDDTIGTCKYSRITVKPIIQHFADSEYGQIFDDSLKYEKICIDNTTYLVSLSSKKYGFAPAFKADGAVETCKRSEKDNQ